jgi:thioredoxin-like negative regulator of GroEL
MAEIIQITDTNEFQSTLAKVAAEQENVIVIFIGTVDPETGKNWCSDCERAKPNINSALLANAKGKVIMCIVKRSEWSGRADHPYKQSAFLKVRGVPTVLLIGNGDSILMRAEKDEDFDNLELLEMIAHFFKVL